MSLRVGFASVMRKIASYLTKNRSETGRKIAQSTHENEYIKPEKTFCGNSKQFLRITTGCPLQEECLRRMFLKKNGRKTLRERRKSVPLQRFYDGGDGRLAQLVQSVCLTSRGSGVRIPQRPRRDSLFVSFRSREQGRLAQLVQSVCLTSRGSGVRIPQRPRREGKASEEDVFCRFCLFSCFFDIFLRDLLRHTDKMRYFCSLNNTYGLYGIRFVDGHLPD